MIDIRQMKAFNTRTRCLSPASRRAPFVRRNDARHDVERDQPLGARVLTIHGEGDP